MNGHCYHVGGSGGIDEHETSSTGEPPSTRHRTVSSPRDEIFVEDVGCPPLVRETAIELPVSGRRHHLRESYYHGRESVISSCSSLSTGVRILSKQTTIAAVDGGILPLSLPGGLRVRVERLSALCRFAAFSVRENGSRGFRRFESEKNKVL